MTMSLRVDPAGSSGGRAAGTRILTVLRPSCSLVSREQQERFIDRAPRGGFPLQFAQFYEVFCVVRLPRLQLRQTGAQCRFLLLRALNLHL